MDHVLRTLAAVPPETSVLVVGFANSSLASDLTRLGFDVSELSVSSEPAEALREHADQSFGWVIAHLSPEASGETYESLRRVLAPGGWAWIGLQSDDARLLDTLALRAGFVHSESVQNDELGGTQIVRGIYRRVEADTTA